MTRYLATVAFCGVCLCSAQAADKMVTLTVTVKDDEGKPLSGAHINVHQDPWWFSRFIVTPPTYQGESGANGVATLEIKAEAGTKLKMRIEISLEDFDTRTENVSLGAEFPSLVERQFKLERKKKPEELPESTTTFAINVVRKDNQEPIEGARIDIASFGGFTPKHFSGQTDSSGNAVIVTALGNDFRVTASKEQFSEASQVIRTGDEYKKQHAVTLALERPSGTVVTVVVSDAENQRPVVDANVVFTGITSSGYHSASTDASGRTTLTVPEMGRFTVRISQEYYETLNDEARLLQGEETKQLEFALKPKPKKEEGKDTIEVTVLKKDPTDEKSRPSPLPGALVKVGGSSVATDGNGQATLNGTFGDNENVTVEATGYKIQAKSVGIARLARFFVGTGKTTFTLDPDLSENTPIRLIVEVVGPDARGKVGPIEGVGVDFATVSGQELPGGTTRSNGEAEFLSSNSPDVPPSELRKGLLITVNDLKLKKGYKDVINQPYPADLLQPSTEPRRVTIQLEKDWSELAKAIRELEAHVAAWETDQHAAPLKGAESQYIDKALAARKNAEQALKEIAAGREAFGISLGPSTRCRKAAELKEAVQQYEADANQKAKDVKQQLDEASAVVSSCAKADDAEHIRKNYRAAIKLVGEIGVLEKKATKDRNDLSSLIQEGSGLKQLLAEMETKLAAISDNLKTAEETEQKAGEQYRHYNDLLKSIAARLVGLKAELAVLEVKYDVDKSEVIPADLRKRVEIVRHKLDTSNVMGPISGEPKSMPKNIGDAAKVVRNIQADAEKVVSQYRAATCDIEAVDQIVEGIGTTLTNASFEIGLAADLPKQADSCAQKIADAADEVEVPDLSVLNDLGAMTRAADQLGLVLRPAATSATPPAGSQRLFGPQSPVAKTKAKRGDPLTIPVYQKLAEKVANPTPTPAAVAAASPKATTADTSPKPTAADEDLVVVPSVAGAKSIEYMRIILNQAEFKSAFTAVPAPDKDHSLTYADQNPAAGEKKKRGSTVVVSVYQKFEDAAAQATATPEELAAASPSATTSTSSVMPNLIGLTLDQATARLASNMKIAGDEVGDKAPTAGKAHTIYDQNPTAGTKIDNDRTIVVNVKRYGSAKVEPPKVAAQPAASATPFRLHMPALKPVGGSWDAPTPLPSRWIEDSRRKP